MWCVLYHWFQFSDSKPFLRYISRYISDFYHIILIITKDSPMRIPAKKGCSHRVEFSCDTLTGWTDHLVCEKAWYYDCGVNRMVACQDDAIEQLGGGKIAATVACCSALKFTLLDGECVSKFNSPNQPFWVKQRRGADSVCLQWVCWQRSEKMACLYEILAVV